jgi:hypothetical protein
MKRWRDIDGQEAKEHARLVAAAQDRKSAVHRACRLAQWELRQIRSERRVGRPRAIRLAPRKAVGQFPMLRERAPRDG